ncbi:MAG TPA: hypothetical protein VJA18_03405 [Candidatus Nanoarchaeia archaeon]|nr:hypothetical protein [Candidatus Nanoarchaeia archaeon]
MEYSKDILYSSHGNLHGRYTKLRDTGDVKVDITVTSNDVLFYLLDKNNDGKADKILLVGYKDAIKEDRATYPDEFKVADQILKYWKETN